MLIRWRFLLGVLPLILLIAGVVNIVLLHSLSSALAPELLHNNDDSPAARYRRQSRNVGSVGRHFPTPRGNGLEAITPGQQAALASREPLGTAVIFPASPGDRATTALAFVLRERGIKPDFCRQDVSRCIAKQILRRKPDLVWLKKEGKVGQIPENALAGVAAVNNLGVGWTVWSRRSLCIALYLNRKALREDPSKSSSMANWYPECYTLPLKPAQAARLRGDKEPDGGMWVLHGSSSSESSIFASGAEAAKSSGAGVLQRYISPPLTLQGYKFSLLVYVVVTSLSPLRAWIYRDGHVLLASQPYSESMQGKDWREAHVTRVDTHPHKVQHIRGKNGLLQHLAASEIAVDRVWSSIEDAVGLSVLSVVSYLTAAPTLAPDNTAGGQANKATRFKLLAAHLVLDVNLNAWVVKLDPSPSLQLNSASEPLAAPAAGNGEAEGFQQQGAGVVDHATGQARLIDDEHPYTQWMFEGDVHHLSKELEQLGAQQSRLGRMRQRRRFCSIVVPLILRVCSTLVPLIWPLLPSSLLPACERSVLLLPRSRARADSDLRLQPQPRCDRCSAYPPPQQEVTYPKRWRVPACNTLL